MEDGEIIDARLSDQINQNRLIDARLTLARLLCGNRACGSDAARECATGRCGACCVGPCARHKKKAAVSFSGGIADDGSIQVYSWVEPAIAGLSPCTFALMISNVRATIRILAFQAEKGSFRVLWF